MSVTSVGTESAARTGTGPACELDAPGAGEGWRAVPGVVGGLLASGCCGTSALTLSMVGVGAGSAAGAIGADLNMQAVTMIGLAVGVALIVGASYLLTRPFRGRVPAPVFRQMLRRNLTRMAAWSVGSYVLWFVIIQPVLGKAGVHVPT